MGNVSINADVCSRCGACVRACPAEIFVRGTQGNPPSLVHEEFCITCGHCVAVCPNAAVSHARFPEGSRRPIDRKTLPSAQQVLELLRARRSVRVFKNRPVEEETLKQILDAAALAPSAHNARDTEFVIIRDKDLLRRISEQTMAYFVNAGKMLRNPITRAFFALIAPRPLFRGAMQMLPELVILEEALAKGEEPILRGAPCLLVSHAAPSLSFPESNAALAIHNATLYAQSLGVGSFQVGFVTGASRSSKALRQVLGIPTGHQVQAALALGYPGIHYDYWPQRQPLQVEWR